MQEQLANRTSVLSDYFKGPIEDFFSNKTEENLQTMVEQFGDNDRLAGLAVYDNKGRIIAYYADLPKNIPQSELYATSAMDSDKTNSQYLTVKGGNYYLLAYPIHKDNRVVGAITIVQNAAFIDQRLRYIWLTILPQYILVGFFLTAAFILITRWILFRPINRLVESLKSARTGSGSFSKEGLPNFFLFSPLVSEISHIKQSLTQARTTATVEARLRQEKLETPWTSQRLQEYVKDILKGRQIFLVSNREPYVHTKHNGSINYFFPASGMATAIEPIMQACGGMWIAHGSGDADKLVVDKNDTIPVPPDEPKYVLKRVWLTPQEENGYYYGFSNEGLWPLCHMAHTRPIFRKDDFEEYKKVNGKFAQTLLAEIKDYPKPIIMVQDFHFALLPQMIKKSRPDATIGMFWHIPWPNPESFSICPWKKELLSGMLGADVLGFHTQLYCNNYINTVGKELESLIDWDQFTVTRGGHTSYIKPFPISIAFSGKDNSAKPSPDESYVEKLGIRTPYIGIGIDRLDYTKGILERFKAIEIFLQKYPAFRNKFTFIQVAAPSRSQIVRYQEFDRAVEKEVARINNVLGANGWKPIVLLKRHHSHVEINQLYRKANVCMVTSLHDGMNLVAKEFIAARDDEMGVLILSQFTGAARELKDALIVNPYNGEQTADSINQALTMMKSEQIRRMKRMRESIKSYNIYRWSADLLKTMVMLG